MEERLAVLITDMSMYSLALPILVGSLRYFRLLTRQKAILYLVLLSFFTEIVAEWVLYNDGNQNLVYFIFTLTEFLLLTYVFAWGIFPFLSLHFFKRISLFFFLYVIVDMIWISGLQQFNNYSTAVESLIVIFYALTFFYKTLQELKIRYLEREPLFWISTGVLLYFSSSLFIFLFTNYVNSSERALFIIWGIHGIFSLGLNLFYSIALWVTPKP